jgi:hypothetical protein
MPICSSRQNAWGWLAQAAAHLSDGQQCTLAIHIYHTGITTNTQQCLLLCCLYWRVLLHCITQLLLLLLLLLWLWQPVRLLLLLLLLSEWSRPDQAVSAILNHLHTALKSQPAAHLQLGTTFSDQQKHPMLKHPQHHDTVYATKQVVALRQALLTVCAPHLRVQYCECRY